MVDVDSQPILVVGMHRSGTSMAAGVVSRLVGDAVDPRPQPSNVHGQYERVDLRPYLDALLVSRRSTWRKPVRGLHRWGSSRTVDGLAKRAVLELGNGRRVWKDPRLCLTLAVWLRHLPAARVVLVFREPTEVAASLQARDGTAVDVGLALWHRYVAVSVAAAAGREVYVVSYRRATADPAAFVAAIGDWLHVADEGRHRQALASVASPRPGRGDAVEGSAATTDLWGRVDALHGPSTLDIGDPQHDGTIDSIIGRSTIGDLGIVGARSFVRLARQSGR